ncbi:MAG TPA: glycosyltransferase [Candidatus Dormibacteraeota bacterium]
MLLEVLLFLAAAILTSTLVMLVPGVARSPIWIGLPLGMLALGVPAFAVGQLTDAPDSAPWLLGLGAAGAGAVRLAMRHWSWPAAQLFAMAFLGALAYLAYSVVVTFGEGLGPAAILGSILLLLLELAALSLSMSYAFEIVDVLGRRLRRPQLPEVKRWPRVGLQVPTYNEPLEVVEPTLRSLANLDYDQLLVQVVDNNTPDPDVWRPLEKLCRELGPRFEFMHLEDWPGFKAGALNEATRRLPEDIDILGIVDADYLVEPGWLKATIGYFEDPAVAFVQTPQDYRDWRDDRYLRALYFSYLYFFAVTMPSRANRNSIIFAGTMGLIRRQALEAIGGWNPEVVTEDAEASLRMLGLGLRAVYSPKPWGRGMMPLSFDGLKKQRFRWALGGIQILRRHWRELLPFTSHRLKLTLAQRIHYLLGSVQWFGDVLNLAFVIVLAATAIATALHHQLPVRVIAGAAIVVPLTFLATGVGRAVWAMKAATGCSWRDAFGALRVWFALNWVVTLACLTGLVRSTAAFLRTPKRREGQPRLVEAVRASVTETTIAGFSVFAAAAMLLAAPALPTAALAVLLLFQAFVYSNSIWASAAAEGITLTPERRAQLRSSQNTGDRPRGGVGTGLALSLAAVGAVVLLGFLAAAPPAPAQPPSIARLPAAKHKPTPAPTPSATPSATRPPSALPSVAPSR